MKQTAQEPIRIVLLIIFLSACCLPARAQSVVALTKEADTLYQSKDWAKAAIAYEAITKAEPANGRAWFRLGMSFHSMGKYEKAAGAIERAAEIGKNPVVMYNLACVYAKMNNKEKAFEWLDSALKAGFPQVGLLKTDADLASLREDARFKDVVALGDKMTRPCMFSPEHRQFDFWIGEWDVQTPQGQLAGTNSVQNIIDGCVIYENWTGTVGGTGKSFNFYNSSTGKWQQTWVASNGTVTEFVGEFKDNQMRFRSESLGKDGTKTLRRLTFFNLSPDRVRQFSERSTDEGKTWGVEYDFTYVRKK
jgi:hypothetical protein